MFSKQDRDFMNAALSLARRGIGRTSPNPSVGCVLVKDGSVIAADRTADGGRPHAEALALEKAGEKAEGATAYVTLEPCAHRGKTPPCAEALVHAGLARIVIACMDADPRVNGSGIEILQKAGIKVDSGLMERQARKLNEGFFARILESRPAVTLKIASTPDGIIAPPAGQRRWITGEHARRHVQLLRSRHDAVLIGIDTALADDPMLTTRLPGLDHKIIRIVLDTNLRLPMQSRLVQTAFHHPLWLFHEKDDFMKAQNLDKAGVRLFKIAPRNLPAVLTALAQEGINDLLVEGGAEMLNAFFQEGLADRFYWYKASADPALQRGKSLSPECLNAVKALKKAESRVLGEDLLEIYERPD